MALSKGPSSSLSNSPDLVIFLVNLLYNFTIKTFQSYLSFFQVELFPSPGVYQEI